jgi:hypothetical protein
MGFEKSEIRGISALTRLKETIFFSLIINSLTSLRLTEGGSSPNSRFL